MSDLWVWTRARDLAGPGIGGFYILRQGERHPWQQLADAARERQAAAELRQAVEVEELRERERERRRAARAAR